MATFTIMGKSYSTNGELPAVGSDTPDFKLTNSHLKDKSLKDFGDKKKIIYTVTSLDTDVCKTTSEKFARALEDYNNAASLGAVLLIVSSDLPFAQSRVYNTRKIENVTVLSGMRNRNFAKDYGVLIQNGPLAGLMARSVIVTDETDKVIHTQLVEEITDEPDIVQALSALN